MSRNYEDPKLVEFETRIKNASSESEKIAISKEAMVYLTETGQKIDVERIEGVVQFATMMVESILDSIVMTAADLGQTEVPVGFLKDLRGSVGPMISQKMFEATDMLGVPLDYGDVPDDLSGLLS